MAVSCERLLFAGVELAAGCLAGSLLQLDYQHMQVQVVIPHPRLPFCYRAIELALSVVVGRCVGCFFVCVWLGLTKLVVMVSSGQCSCWWWQQQHSGMQAACTTRGSMDILWLCCIACTAAVIAH